MDMASLFAWPPLVVEGVGLNRISIHETAVNEYMDKAWKRPDAYGPPDIPSLVVIRGAGEPRTVEYLNTRIRIVEVPDLKEEQMLVGIALPEGAWPVRHGFLSGKNHPYPVFGGTPEEQLRVALSFLWLASQNGGTPDIITSMPILAEVRGSLRTPSLRFETIEVDVGGDKPAGFGNVLLQFQPEMEAGTVRLGNMTGICHQEGLFAHGYNSQTVPPSVGKMLAWGIRGAFVAGRISRTDLRQNAVLALVNGPDTDVPELRKDFVISFEGEEPLSVARLEVLTVGDVPSNQVLVGIRKY